MKDNITLRKEITWWRSKLAGLIQQQERDDRAVNPEQLRQLDNELIEIYESQPKTMKRVLFPVAVPIAWTSGFIIGIGIGIGLAL